MSELPLLKSSSYVKAIYPDYKILKRFFKFDFKSIIHNFDINDTTPLIIDCYETPDYLLLWCLLIDEEIKSYDREDLKDESQLQAVANELNKCFRKKFKHVYNDWFYVTSDYIYELINL